MKCDFCTSDFVRKETYKAHILSQHRAHLSDYEYEEVLEKIRKFQAPQLDVSQFTVEKQLGKMESQSLIVEEEAEIEGIIEDERVDPLEEAGEGYEIYEDSEEMIDQ